MATSAEPIAPSERILTLDVIRGLALLGILIMNMPAFNTSFFAGAAAREHTREMIFSYTDPVSLRGYVTWYTQLFTTMIIGLVLGRRRFFQNVTPYLPLVKRVLWWALAIGVFTGVVFGYWEATVVNPSEPTLFKVISRICYFASRISIMVFYVALIVVAMQHETWRRRLAPMAIVGRMPLTNYLLQTLIATFLFYGWGLGLWLKVGSALDLVLAFAIFFVVQLPLTKLWLRHFEMGPMEFLWRWLTYGHASLKRRAVTGTAPA